MKQEMQGRGSAKVRDFALFGETTGETDEFGLPVRYNWASEYRGRASVVYGHTPVPEPEWLNRTINIDTGCVFGGRLTALRWPEKEMVSVAARQTYADPVRPFLPVVATSGLSAQQANDDLLDIDDVRGKRLVTTRLHRNVTIREENAAAALEVMSRFGANPKWLIYLPPTMSPSETTKREGLLELVERHKVRQELADRFARAYCWPVESLRDIRIAPFHVMATEGAVHTDKDHVWHMNTIGSFVDPDGGLLMGTPYHVVQLADAASESAATEWWTGLTESGGEGAVVKPLSFVATGSRGLLQPAVKCRGREYLRIIYGPEYTLPEHVQRLRERGLSGKRSLALREFALGIEGLERFVQREPLRRVHECVFGVLAVESEPVDPRL